MAEDDVERVLVLAPMAWEALPNSGTILADCGHACWITGTGVQARLSGSMSRTVCVPCAYRDTEKIAGIEALPGAVDELAEVMPRSVAEQVVRGGLAYGRRLAKRKPQ